MNLPKEEIKRIHAWLDSADKAMDSLFNIAYQTSQKKEAVHIAHRLASHLSCIRFTITYFEEKKRKPSKKNDRKKPR